MKRKIFIGIVALLVLIQFIRPARNQSSTASPNDITAKFAVPADVKQILDKACYDCHSNNTYYPWYSNIQPVGWWLQWHVNEGKHELNFNEFTSYPAKKQDHKMEEVMETVKKGEMPMDSYTWMHDEAKLTEQEKQTLINWAAGIRKQVHL